MSARPGESWSARPGSCNAHPANPDVPKSKRCQPPGRRRGAPGSRRVGVGCSTHAKILVWRIGGRPEELVSAPACRPQLLAGTQRRVPLVRIKERPRKSAGASQDSSPAAPDTSSGLLNDWLDLTLVSPADLIAHPRCSPRSIVAMAQVHAGRLPALLLWDLVQHSLPWRCFNPEKVAADYAKWRFGHAALNPKEQRRLGRRFGRINWEKARRRLDQWQRTRDLVNEEARRLQRRGGRTSAFAAVAERQKRHPCSGATQVCKEIEALERAERLSECLATTPIKNTFVKASRQAFSASKEGRRRLEALRDQRKAVRRALSRAKSHEILRRC
jgi:hypothetical protein